MGTMTRRGLLHLFALSAFVLLIWVVARIGCAVLEESERRDIPPAPSGVHVNAYSETTMKPLDVKPPQQQRWRDITDTPYGDGFRAAFSYADTEEHRAIVRCDREAMTLRGSLTAHRLKPLFAYQMKMVGLEPVLGAREAENAGDRRAWSSWQLGRLGRWWCEECGWNVDDTELESHVNNGHAVTGYLLFDWFVTDEEGNAEHPFSVDSSLHVLWRGDQRERGPNDSQPRWHTVGPRRWAPQAERKSVWLFAEWEPDRPKIGRLCLPPGEYEVAMNLTEESFHANMDEERALDGGGFWAWVLQSELQFEVREWSPH